jgi:hypothetical protein
MDFNNNHYGIAYAVSIIGSQFVIKYIIENMWKQVDFRINKDPKFPKLEETRPFSQISQIIGLLESVLYTTAFLVDKYEFIGLWLLLKIGGSFKRGSKYDERYERHIFNIFLIGSGLSIIFSFVGFLISKQLSKQLIGSKDCFSIILLAGSLIVLSLVMYGWSKYLLDKEQSNANKN